MKRKIVNKKSIFFLVLVSISTILSFVFDQLVINQEDKIRNEQVVFSEIESSLNEVTSQSLTYVQTGNSLAGLVLATSTRFEIFFNLTNISNDEDYISSVRSTNRGLYRDYYKNIFKGYIDELNYRYVHILLNGRLNLNGKLQKDFTEKFYKKYDFITQQILELQKGYAEYSKNSSDANKLIVLYVKLNDIFKNLSELSTLFAQESEYLDEKRDNIQDKIELVTENINYHLALKNTLILISVVFQIFSLLFLSLLFKQIVISLQKIKSKKIESVI